MGFNSVCERARSVIRKAESGGCVKLNQLIGGTLTW